MLAYSFWPRSSLLAIKDQGPVATAYDHSRYGNGEPSTRPMTQLKIMMQVKVTTAYVHRRDGSPTIKARVCRPESASFAIGKAKAKLGSINNEIINVPAKRYSKP